MCPLPFLCLKVFSFSSRNGDTMTLEKFAEKMRGNVEKRLPGIKVRVTQVRKNNGVKLTGLVFEAEGTNISPTVYMEEFYDSHHMGQTMDELTDSVIDVYNRSVPKCSLNFDFFKEYDKVKDRIGFRLVNARENKELLEQVPYIPYLDLAIVFFYALESEELGEGTIQIYKNHMRLWKVTEEELYQTAMENMPCICPSEFGPLADFILEMAGDMAPQDVSEEFCLAEPKLYVLSNDKHTHGAGTMLYPGVMEMIYKEISDNFYIIPSSVHELIVWRDDGRMSPQELADMITEVNHTQLRQEEILAHHPYYYDGKDKRILIF